MYYMNKSSLRKNIRNLLPELLKRILFLFLSALAFLLIGHYVSRNVEYEYTDIEKTSVTPKAVHDSNGHLYTLTLENEKLVIYSADGKSEFVDADTKLFTEYDKALLHSGITGDINEINNIIGYLTS